MTAAADDKKKAEAEAKKIVADAKAEAKKLNEDATKQATEIVDNAKKTAEKTTSDAEAKAAELQKGTDETVESTVNDKFNALWAQINEEYEDDTLRATVLAQLEALQFAAKQLDD